MSDQLTADSLNAGGSVSPDAFISHASADKNRFVRPLVEQLEARGYTIWFDEYEIVAGDSLFREINRGLSISKVGIVVFSKAFLGDNGDGRFWTNEELDGFHALQSRLYTIALGIDVEQVKKFAPTLAGKRIIEGKNPTAVADQLARAFVKHGVGNVKRSPTLQRPGKAIWITETRGPAVEGFVGREAALDKIGEFLGSDETAIVSQAISGLGGVGKTKLAGEYVHRNADRFDMVGWLDCGERSRTAVLADLGRGLADPSRGGRLPELPESVTEEETAAAALAWLQNSTENWLIVLDNVEDPEIVTPFVTIRDQRSERRLLVTTRSSKVAALGKSLNLGVFDRGESIDYLMADSGEQAGDEEAAGRLAEALGDLPLALAQARSWIERTHGTFDRFLERAVNRPALSVLNDSPDRFYEKTIATTWQISIEAAVKEAPAALAVLSVISLLSPEPVRSDWFQPLLWTDGIAPEGESAKGAVEDLCDHTFAALFGFSLIDVVTDRAGRFTAHRLIQKVVREAVEASGVEGSESAAVELLDLASPAASPQSPKTWDEWREIAPHVQSLQQRLSSEAGRRADVGSSLSWQCGMFLYAAGRLGEAIELQERVLEERERILGLEHPDTISARNNLANSYGAAGRLGEAIELQERVLESFERILGLEHPDTIKARGNLANSYFSAGRLGEAIELRERVLEERERILGLEHPDTIKARNNLANSYGAAGRLGEAIELRERVLDSFERILGLEHPDTIKARNNLTIMRGEST